MSGRENTRSTYATRGPERNQAKEHHHQGHNDAGPPFPIRRALPPVTECRIDPGQSEKKKHRANGLVEDLPGGPPEGAKETSGLCRQRSCASHKIILSQKLRAKSLLITGPRYDTCFGGLQRLQFRYVEFGRYGPCNLTTS